MGFAYFEISRAFSGIIRDFLTHKTGFSDTQNWIFEPRAPQISTSTSISTCKITSMNYITNAQADSRELARPWPLLSPCGSSSIAGSARKAF